MYRVNATGAGIVMEAALSAKGTKAILTSSVAAIGGSFLCAPRQKTRRSTPMTSGSTTAAASCTANGGAKAAIKGLPLVILRPAVILGPNDILQSSTSTILAFVRRKMPSTSKAVPALGMFARWRRHVAALHKGRPGQVYILGGNNVTLTELLTALEDLTGIAPPPQVPYPLAYSVAGVLEYMARLQKQHASLSRQLAKAGHMCTWVSSDKAKAELDYTIRPLADSLRDTIRFFPDHGPAEALHRQAARPRRQLPQLSRAAARPTCLFRGAKSRPETA